MNCSDCRYLRENPRYTETQYDYMRYYCALISEITMDDHHNTEYEKEREVLAVGIYVGGIDFDSPSFGIARPTEFYCSLWENKL